MKPLSELRTVLNFYPHQLNHSLGNFAKQKIDFNVFLKTKGFNLQRDFVWNIDQKRELIWSILIRRHIPRMSFVFTINDVYKIVDGKQRISTMLNFYNNDFSIFYNGKEYYYDDLPKEHQRAIKYYQLSFNIYNEEIGKPLTDRQLIDWFKFINFAGTQQEISHLNKLT